ncbi:MAG TPA: HAMP domain-containing sensor histidine kinase [Ilumatobacteraceae bacterium]|jgi:signal transduction histidine kinase|nr:HAMP domain-containing sensor histidine kinase [Ilumatobacteraceae bacterium]
MRLRTKVSLLFGIIALIATVSLTVVTYAFARSSLLEQRWELARTQAVSNALRVRERLRSGDSIGDWFPNLRVESPGGFAAVILDNDETVPTDTRYSYDSFPDDLLQAVEIGVSGVQRFDLGDEHYVGVGVKIAEVDANYFEAFQLGPTEDTLRTILVTLVIGSLVTVLLASFVGWWTSGRLLRPLGRITDAAGEIAAGDLDTRVVREGDPDLDRLADSFNDMADAVQARIEREARFASDVSHELRSPITALAAAAEVIDGRRGELPDRTQQALDVVVGQVRRFDAMVIDLLELSRIDAGATDLHTEDVEIETLCRRVAARNGFAHLPIEVTKGPGMNGAPMTATVDRLRFERILTNLLENASHHGGGPTRVSIEPTDGPFLLVAVEDAGPGVARGERARIFERFARGSAARHRIGTGLGLALVAEHATAQGGEAWVEDRPGGGARFVVRLPIGSDR